MTINRIPGGHGSPALAPGSRDHTPIDESNGKAIHTPAHGGLDAARRLTEEVPVGAPPGTDSALWSVLTQEERSFFAAADPAGPPTYGPTKGGWIAPGALLGSLIDLRV